MLRTRHARARPSVGRLHPHQAHESPDPVPARGDALAAQMPHQLPAAVEGIRVFSIHFGFTRIRCMNSVIADESVRVSLAHTEDIERRIESEINEAKFQRVADRFEGYLKPFGDTSIPKARFRPIIQSVLEIQEPARMPNDRRESWQTLEQVLDRTSDGNVRRFGENAYALLNAITDLATRPPTKEQVGYSFIRRERHSLQLLAGRWVAEFSRSLRRPGFDLDAYLTDPSAALLRTGNGTRIP